MNLKLKDWLILGSVIALAVIIGVISAWSFIERQMIKRELALANGAGTTQVATNELAPDGSTVRSLKSI